MGAYISLTVDSEKRFFAYESEVIVWVKGVERAEKISDSARLFEVLETLKKYRLPNTPEVQGKFEEVDRT